MSLIIGDVHIKKDNLPLVDLFIAKLNTTLSDYELKHIILLGDILHYHEKVFVPCYNKALEMVHMLRQHAKVYVIVGNHDMISGAQFLTDNHWMNGLKKWSNVQVVDLPIRIGDDVYVPYVPAGRFFDALERVKWQDATTIFCHQEFYGCSMGKITSNQGDKWNDSYPQIISGHIHNSQKVGEKVYYVGSSLSSSFAETERKKLLYIKTNGEWENVYLDMPQKKTSVVSLEDMMDASDITADRIRVNGTVEQYATFRKSKTYKDLLEKGIKVVFNVPKTDTTIEHGTFKELLQQSIIREKENVKPEVYQHLIDLMSEMV